ncbi:MAG: thiamine phosphate synthase, partial [Thermomicrobiales bacterium]|nr:thiamine phosphate synthase [Thermomicrobiales bacterium]
MRPTPRLMLVLGSRPARLPLAELAARAVAGGVDAVQLRDRSSRSPRETRALAEAIRARIADRAALIINDDPALAAALGCGL